MLRFSEKPPALGARSLRKATRVFGGAVRPHFPLAGPGSVLSSLLEGAGPFSVLHPFQYLKSASFPFLKSSPEFLVPVLLA